MSDAAIITLKLKRLLAQTEITYFELDDRSVVASAEAPVVVPEPVGFMCNRRKIGHVLCGSAQQAPALFSIQGANA